MFSAQETKKKNSNIQMEELNKRYTMVSCDEEFVEVLSNSIPGFQRSCGLGDGSPLTTKHKVHAQWHHVRIEFVKV